MASLSRSGAAGHVRRPDAEVTTPFNVFINRGVEEPGTRHGSVGVGFGETIERSELGHPPSPHLGHVPRESSSVTSASGLVPGPKIRSKECCSGGRLIEIVIRPAVLIERMVQRAVRSREQACDGGVRHESKMNVALSRW
jgi:hypothetical protein